MNNDSINNEVINQNETLSNRVFSLISIEYPC